MPLNIKFNAVLHFGSLHKGSIITYNVNNKKLTILWFVSFTKLYGIQDIHMHTSVIIFIHSHSITSDSSVGDNILYLDREVSILAVDAEH